MLCALRVATFTVRCHGEMLDPLFYLLCAACSGLPICAVDYPAAAEQVTPGETGVLFKTPAELCAAWTRLLAADAASDAHERGHAAEHAGIAATVRQRRQEWGPQWGQVVAPLVDGLAPRLRRRAA